MLRNLLTKLPVIASTTEQSVSSACNVRNFRNVSPMRKPRSSSNSGGRRSNYSFTAARRSLSFPRTSGKYCIVGQSKALESLKAGFCQAKDSQDVQEDKRAARKKSEAKEFEIGTTYYEPTEQYELEASQPKQHGKDIKSGATIEDLRKIELIESEKRSQTDGLQPANLRPFGSQDNMFCASLFKPSNTIRYPNVEFQSNEMDVTEHIEPVETGVKDKCYHYDKPQNRRYSTTAPRPATINVNEDPNLQHLKINVRNKTSLQEKRRTQIEDYIYQKYKSQDKKTDGQLRTKPQVETPNNDLETVLANVTGAIPSPVKATTEDNFAKTFSKNVIHKRPTETEKLPTTRSLSRITPNTKKEPVSKNISKEAHQSSKYNVTKTTTSANEPKCDDICSIYRKKKKKPPGKYPFEPEICDVEPPVPKKILMASKIRLKVPPCHIRPDYDCPQKPTCPPRADDCKEFVFKPLRKMEPKDCECKEEVGPSMMPKLKRLDLKVEPPPRVVCVKPKCIIPRADDANKYKFKPLKPYVAKDCACIERPPMKDVNFTRLGPCKSPEICRPPRKCPPIKVCPPRADDGLHVNPRVLPILEAKPCPCIEAPPLKDIKVKRLNLHVPEPKRVCPPAKICPTRADDNYVIRPKQLKHIEPGVCPCVDRPMTDVNFRRLQCKDIEYECVVPDPCKITPRADWGCWEYEAWECKQVDPKCVDPPPCPPEIKCPTDPCVKKDPCKQTGTRDILSILKNSKREFNTDSTLSDTNIKMKLFRQLKSRTAKNKILSPKNIETSIHLSKDIKSEKSLDRLPKPSLSEKAIAKVKSSHSGMFVKPLKSKKSEYKVKVPPATVKLIERLADLEKKKMNPLLFQPVEDTKLSISKVGLVTEKMSIAPNMNQSTVSVTTTRSMSTEKNGSSAKNRTSRLEGNAGKSKSVNRSSIYSRVQTAPPTGTRGEATESDCPTREENNCKRRAVLTKCTPKPGAPYPSYSECAYGEILPFIRSTRWKYDGFEEEDQQKRSVISNRKPGATPGAACGSKRQYSTSTRPPSAPMCSRNTSEKFNIADRKLSKKPSFSQNTDKASKGLAPPISKNANSKRNVPNKPCLVLRQRKPRCPVLNVGTCPDKSIDTTIYEETCIEELGEPKPKSPFPSFSECLTEEAIKTSPICPEYKKSYQQVQPAHMVPMAEEKINNTIYPRIGPICFELEKDCRKSMIARKKEQALKPVDYEENEDLALQDLIAERKLEHENLEIRRGKPARKIPLPNEPFSPKIQPSFIKPLNEFEFTSIYPKHEPICHEMEKLCRESLLDQKTEREIKDKLALRQYEETDKLIEQYLTEKRMKHNQAVKRKTCVVPKHTHNRKFSTQSCVDYFQTRNFATGKKTNNYEQIIDEMLNNNTFSTRRIYIRNYNMFCKNPDRFYKDIDEKIEELSEKFNETETSCKLVKVRSLDCRRNTFKKYERLNKYKNIPKSIKRFFKHSKSKYKMISRNRDFFVPTKVSQLGSISRTLSTNMSLAKTKKHEDDKTHDTCAKADKTRRGKKFQLTHKKKVKPTESMLKLDKKVICAPPEPPPKVANPNITIDEDSSLTGKFSRCTEIPPCPKFRLSECPEKTVRPCKFKPPRGYPPCNKVKSPYKSFSECNEGNIFPDPNTECPFVRENMKEVLQPRFHILPETGFEFMYPKIQPVDAKFELQYIQKRLGIENKGLSQDCESFGTCIRLPKCIEFEALERQEIEEVPRKVGKGCDPDFKMKPCGPRRKLPKPKPSPCKLGQGPSSSTPKKGSPQPEHEPIVRKRFSRMDQNGDGSKDQVSAVNVPGVTDRDQFIACEYPNILGISKEYDDGMLPELPPDFQTSKYIEMNINNDEANLTEYTKNKVLNNVTFQNQGKEETKAVVEKYLNDYKNKNANTSLIKADKKERNLIIRINPDFQAYDQEIKIKPKFSTNNQSISWFQHLKGLLYPSSKQNNKGYHGYLQIPTCIAEDDNKNSAICDLPRSLLLYKKRKEKKTGIVKNRKKLDCEDIRTEHYATAKHKNRMILCESPVICEEDPCKDVNKPEKCDISCIISPDCSSVNLTRKNTQLQPTKQKTTNCEEEIKDIAAIKDCGTRSPESPEERKIAEDCCEIKVPQKQNQDVCCEIKHPQRQAMRSKSSSETCEEKQSRLNSVKTFSETCIKIQQTKTEECSPSMMQEPKCVPKPKKRHVLCKVECKPVEAPTHCFTPSACPSPPTVECPPPTPPPKCTPPKKSKCTKDSLLAKLKKYFKARPDCPAPDEWKRKALKEKAEKAAHKAGLVAIDPRMLPKDIRNCICNGKLDIEMCRSICDEEDVPRSQNECKQPCEKPCKTLSAPKVPQQKRCSDCNSNRCPVSKYNKCEPISCCNRAEFNPKRNFSTLFIQMRWYSRNFTRRNLDEINRILEEEELKKKRKMYEDYYQNSDYINVRSLENYQQEDDSNDFRNLPVSRKHKIVKNGRLVQNNNVEIYFMNENMPSEIPSRENILQNVLQISFSDLPKRRRVDLFNLMEDTTEHKRSLSVEEWEYLKTQDVLRALDAMLKKKMSDED